MRQPARPLSLAVASLVALIVTGCSSASHPATSATRAARAPGSTSSAPATGSSATSSAAGASGKPVNVCTVIDAATATKLTGQKISTAVPRTGLQAKEYGCAYGNADDSLQVEVTVFEHNAPYSYTYYSTQSKHVSPVNGVGDKAFYDNDSTLYALRGSNLIQVNGLDSADGCAKLARTIIAAL